MAFGFLGAFLRMMAWLPFMTVWARFLSNSAVVYVLEDRSEIGLPRTRSGWTMAISLVFSYTAFTWACTLMPVLQVTVTFFTYPIISLVIGAVAEFRKNGQLPTLRDALCALAGFATLVFTSYSRWTRGDVLATALAAFGALVWGFGTFILKRNHGKEPRSAVFVTSQVMGAVLLTPMAVVFFMRGYQQPPTAFQASIFILIGVLATKGFVWYSDALKLVPPHRASAFMNIQVFISAIAGWIVNHERPLATEWAGMVAIVIINWILMSQEPKQDIHIARKEQI